jgi:hypothetical protein
VPYVGFGQNGPRKATQIDLCSVDEKGLILRFSSLNVSNDNRINGLLGDMVTQISTKGPQFPNPVILVKPGNYVWNGKTVWHFDYEIVDWMANDGVSLQSQAVPLVAAGGGNGSGDDGGDDVDADDEGSWDEDSDEDAEAAD